MRNLTMVHLLGIGTITFLSSLFLFQLISYLKRRLIQDPKRICVDFATFMVKETEERRQDSRIEIKWPVIMETSKETIKGETKNFSLAGAFIISKIPIPLGEVFSITIDIPKYKPLSFIAEVIWNNTNVPDDRIVTRGIGIRFIRLSNEDRRFLNDAVSLYQDQEGEGTCHPALQAAAL